MLPLAANAQVHNPSARKGKSNEKEHKSIKVNKLEVIDPDDEYTGMVLEDETTVPEEEHVIYQRPFIINPPEEDEEELDPPHFFQLASEDEGADNEEDILMAGDSTMIHSPKADISQLSEPVVIHLTNESAGEKFSFPTPDIARATSHWGPRRRRFHYGVDLAMKTGEPIYATFDGVVRISKFNRSYGNLIVIRHNNGLETYYAHLSKRHVTPGTHVRAGDIIGLCGNTGRSYGSHLHFEVRYKGNAMNPENVINCTTHELVTPVLTLTKDSFRKSAARTATASSGNAKSASTNYSGNGKYYKVRSGDTLSKIASRNGTTIRRLCQLNGIKETSVLRVGQRLQLR